MYKELQRTSTAIVFCSLNFLFSDVAVAVVIFLNSLLSAENN